MGNNGEGSHLGSERISLIFDWCPIKKKRSVKKKRLKRQEEREREDEGRGVGRGVVG